MPKPSVKFRLFAVLIFLGSFLTANLVSPNDLAFSHSPGRHDGDCSFTVSPDTIYLDTEVSVKITSPNDSNFHEDYFVILRDVTGNRNVITLLDGDGTHRINIMEFKLDLTEINSRDALLLLNDFAISAGASYTGIGKCTNRTGEEWEQITIAGESLVPPDGCFISVNPSGNITTETELAFSVQNFQGPHIPGVFIVGLKKNVVEDTNYSGGIFIGAGGNSTTVARITVSEDGDYHAILLNGNSSVISSPLCNSIRFNVTDVSRISSSDTSADTTSRLTGNTQKVVESLMTFGLGIAGGVAFLLLVYGSLKFIFSAGNPDSVTQAREVITSAVIGLLVVVFSVFLLRLIGISILGLPI